MKPDFFKCLLSREVPFETTAKWYIIERLKYRKGLQGGMSSKKRAMRYLPDLEEYGISEITDINMGNTKIEFDTARLKSEGTAYLEGLVARLEKIDSSLEGIEKEYKEYMASLDSAVDSRTKKILKYFGWVYRIVNGLFGSELDYYNESVAIERVYRDNKHEIAQLAEYIKDNRIFFSRLKKNPEYSALAKEGFSKMNGIYQRCESIDGLIEKSQTRLNEF